MNINDWGSVVWDNLVAAFFGCTNLDVTATGVPNINNLQFMNAMFRDCGSLIGNSSFGQWQLPSNITSLHSLFRNAELFNVDISDWDTSRVFNFTHLFSGARSFNQPIGKWDTSNVFSFRNMFKSADISLPFAFDQSLANWNITSLTQAENMLQGGKLSTTNYDATLISWASQNITNSVTIDFGNSQYTTGGAAEAARNTLINTYGWTIIDGGEVVNPDDFVFKAIIATDGDAFVLPLDTTSNINASIDWGDGTVNTVTSYNDPNAFHTYTTAGTYTVSMSGIIDGWDYLSPSNAGTDKTQLGDISNWGTFESTMLAGFYQCTNLTVSATDTLTITNGSNVFNGCTSLTTIDLSNWDVSGTTTMTAMFRSCTSLTSAIFTGLDTSTITSFNSLFLGATSLATVTDCDSLNFDIATDISSCFNGCTGLTGALDFSNLTINASTFMVSVFNGCTGLTSIDLSNGCTTVERTFGMFNGCTNLTSVDMTGWVMNSNQAPQDTFHGCTSLTTITGHENFGFGGVTFSGGMSSMFEGCSSLLTLDTSLWTLTGVQSIESMFKGGATVMATVTDIENWDISALTNATDFMLGTAGISTSVYNATLVSWAAQTPQSNINIDFGGSQYTLGGAAEAARNTLINTYGWTITDGGGV